MARLRIEHLVLTAAIAIGLVVTFVLGLRQYMGATAEVLHPSPQAIPSDLDAPPAPAWAAAVAKGREATRAALSAENLPGLSVAVGVGNALVWAEGFGWADLERRSPVTPDTRFRLGTASIPLTAVAVGRLVERGRLAFDDEVQKYVPAFPRQAAPVTLRQIMGHVAGLWVDGGDESPLFERHCEHPVEALPVFAPPSLRLEPGAAYRFSSYGWIVMGAVAEAAAGEPFQRVMRKEVFEPAGLDDTMPESVTEVPDEISTFYFPRFGADPLYGLHLSRPLDYSCYAGASGYLSTAADVVRFGLAAAHGRLLRPETLQEMQTPTRLPSGGDTGYGLGWNLGRLRLDDREAPVVGHDGDILGGMTASLLTVPSHDLVVAVLANMPYAKTSALAARLAEAFAAGAAGEEVR